MDIDSLELEREASRLRAEAVSLWLSKLPKILRNAGRSFVAFIGAFRAFKGIRA